MALRGAHIVRRTDPERPDVVVWPTAPEFGEIVFTRTPGRTEVTQAPQRARVSLALLAGSCGHEVQVFADKIMLAEQVVYAVERWDPVTASLEVRLIEDRRKR
jgi:hypothetical protein